MDDKKYIVAGVVAVAFLALFGLVLFQGRPNINLSVVVDGKPVTISMNGQPVSLSADGKPVVVSGDAATGGTTSNQTGEKKFGAGNPGETTNWISGAYSDALDVAGATTLNTLNVTGETNSGYLAHVASSTIVSVTTTQDVCRLQNTYGSAKRLVDVGITYSARSVAQYPERTVTSTINLSNNPTLATSTGQMYGDVTTLSTVSSTLTTTSTLLGTGGVASLWGRNQYLHFGISAPTTTLAGNCYAIYY
jgi:hypothetical protein